MVPNMRQFVRYNAFQFFIIQLVDNTFRKRHGISPFIYSTGESIQRIIVYHIDLRHLHTLTHTKVFHQIIYPLVIFSFQRNRTRSRTNDTCIGKIGNQEPNQYTSDDIRNNMQEHIITIKYDQRHIRLVIRHRNIMQKETKQISQPNHQAGKQTEQKQRPHVVSALLCLNSDIFHTLKTNFRSFFQRSTLFTQIKHHFFMETKHTGNQVRRECLDSIIQFAGS